LNGGRPYANVYSREFSHIKTTPKKRCWSSKTSHQ